MRVRETERYCVLAHSHEYNCGLQLDILYLNQHLRRLWPNDELQLLYDKFSSCRHKNHSVYHCIASIVDTLDMNQRKEIILPIYLFQRYSITVESLTPDLLHLIQNVSSSECTLDSIHNMYKRSLQQTLSNSCLSIGLISIKFVPQLVLLLLPLVYYYNPSTKRLNKY